VAEIAALPQHRKFRAPTVIVVGEVVRLGQELQWFHSRKSRSSKSDMSVAI
jgi:siroheme synthase